jgi:hypothetical protein
MSGERMGGAPAVLVRENEPWAYMAAPTPVFDALAEKCSSGWTGHRTGVLGESIPRDR